MVKMLFFIDLYTDEVPSIHSKSAAEILRILHEWVKYFPFVPVTRELCVSAT
jgi:hypothetical protein